MILIDTGDGAEENRVQPFGSRRNQGPSRLCGGSTGKGIREEEHIQQADLDPSKRNLTSKHPAIELGISLHFTTHLGKKGTFSDRHEEMSLSIRGRVKVF